MIVRRRRAERASVRARALSLTLRCTVRPVVQAWSWAPGLPWPYGVVDHAGRLTGRLRETVFETVDLPRCRAQWVRVGDAPRRRVILYFPGGAFLVGGWHLHRGMLSRLAESADADILAVGYRKLPRHGIGEGIEDALAAYWHLLTQGVAPEEIVVMGDSAGGYLSLVLAAQLREEGLPAPAAVVAISPLLDLDASMLSRRSCAVLTPRAVGVLARVGRRGGHRVTPMSQAHPELPPVLIQVARHEILRRQVDAFATRLEQLGAPVTVETWPLDIHVFQAAGWLPETRAALLSLRRFLDQVSEIREEPTAITG